MIGAANAGPDAATARSASRVILIAVSQDGLDTSYGMRFWDIFSLATDTKEIGVAAEET